MRHKQLGIIISEAGITSFSRFPSSFSSTHPSTGHVLGVSSLIFVHEYQPRVLFGNLR